MADIGVMLLMFDVGLHFSLNDLLKVRKIAVPWALLQIIANISNIIVAPGSGFDYFCFRPIFNSDRL
jgi:monovalent cation:H+ antiporter-2, CPA2 family